MHTPARTRDLRKLVNQLSHRAGHDYGCQLAAQLLAEVRQRLASGEASEAIADDLLARHAPSAATP
jgi:cytochrome c-type biogenesis protein CcmH/NrfF